MPTTIHIIDGEKGGVGKSFFSQVLVEYHLSKEIPHIIVDADISNPDVSKKYPDNSQVTEFSELEKKQDLTDIIIELALENNVVLNLPGQILSKLQNWFDVSNIFSVCKENNISIVRWFVSNGSFDNIRIFKESLEYYSSIQNILVKNLKMEDEWDFLDEDVELDQLMKKSVLPGKIIEFPICSSRERYSMEQHSLTFTEAMASKELKLLAKQRVQRFINKAFEQIEAIKVIDINQSKSTTKKKAS